MINGLFKVLRQASVAYAEMLLSFLFFILSIVSPCPCLFFLNKGFILKFYLLWLLH